MDPVLLAEAYPDTASAWGEQQPEATQTAHTPGTDLADVQLRQWETVD